MSDIINLRQARKQRDRRRKADIAAGNRAKFGRSKAEKKLGQARAALDDKKLDGARLDHDDPQGDDKGAS